MKLIAGGDRFVFLFFFNDTATTEIYTLSLHDALPICGSRVVAADYDGDGDIDLFVGGRVVPWRYGADPQSMLLQNDGHGHFTDVTAQLAPELARVGMVTDAVWQDVDGDGRLDLVVVGEWMPITIFHNAGGGKLARLNTPGLERSNGWWKIRRAHV